MKAVIYKRRIKTVNSNDIKQITNSKMLVIANNSAEIIVN